MGQKTRHLAAAEFWKVPCTCDVGHRWMRQRHPVVKNARHHDLDGDVGGDDMQSRYSATYGSLGAVIVLLLWFYMSGPSILMSAEINSVLENAAADAGEPDANMKVRRHHIIRPQQQEIDKLHQIPYVVRPTLCKIELRHHFRT
jgi:hypothetical protein